MKYSRYALKRTTYPNCFCFLVSQMATLNPKSYSLAKGCLSLLQKWISKVQTRSSTCLLLTAAFFLSHSTWLQTHQSRTLQVHILQTSYLDSNSFTDVSAKKIQKVPLCNSQTLNHLAILFWLENNIIGEILLKTKLNTFIVLCQKSLHSMVAENCSETFKSHFKSKNLIPPLSLSCC